MLLQLRFVLLYHSFADEFCALDPAFIDDDLVMLAQLDLIILDSFVEGVVLVAALLNVVDYLQQIDRHRKDLSSCLQHLLVFFQLPLVLLLQLLLVLCLTVGALQHRLQLRLPHTGRLLERQRTLNISRNTFRFIYYSNSSRDVLSYQYFRYSRM